MDSLTRDEIYRVVFETVHTHRLAEFCDCDPATHHSRDVHQIVPNSQIPDDAWYEVKGRETDSPWQQYDQLRQWSAEDRQFVRNIRLEKLASPPVWEPVSQ